jgi:antitoxin HicB
MGDLYMGHEPHIGQQATDRLRASHQEDSLSARHLEVRAKRATASRRSRLAHSGFRSRVNPRSVSDGPDRAASPTDEPAIPDAFQKQDGKPEAFEAAAIKEVLARQIAEAMKAQNLSRKRLAERMKTSRSQISRLLDPKDGNVTIATLQRAAKVVGRTIRVELVQVQSEEDDVETRRSTQHNIEVCP